jgi:hypothetical protein
MSTAWRCSARDGRGEPSRCRPRLNQRAAAPCSVTWGGRDDNGAGVASGSDGPFSSKNRRQNPVLVRS